MATQDEENLKIQEEINEALRRRSVLLQRNTQELKEQFEISEKIKDSFSGIKISTETSSRLQAIKQSLMEAAEEAKGFDDVQRDMAKEMAEGMSEADETFDGFIERLKQSTKEIDSFSVGAFAFVDGIMTSLKGLKNTLGGIIDIAFSAANGLFQIGKAIISIPFKMLNALVDEANRIQGGTELAQAFEEIRKFSGNFREDVSKNIIKGSRSMRGELANTGLSVYRTAGMLWERLNLLRDIAEKMGNDFHVFGTEIKQNAEVMIAYQKALAMTGEEMAGFSALAVKNNKTLEETFRNVATMTTGLGEHFGISQKMIARDVGEMVKDLKTFGSVGVRQMAQLSVYSKKLGVNFKELLGIVDKFDNFGDAAENAARLSQAFGVNLDVMKMMNEQDPGKRIDSMRQAFFNAGKSIERMTRQERAYLAQTSGVEENALDQVFALKNQKVSYDEISRSGGIAEKQQLSTAEAMKKLAASIERIVRSGHRQGGFWDRFMLGFATGARRAMAVDRVWRNIRRSLWQAEMAGRAVGRMFIRLFPGMNQISKGFAAIFHPKKFKELRFGVVSAFRQLFNDLKNPQAAKKALDNFFKNLKAAFGKIATKEMNPLSSIFEGFKKAFKAVGQIFLSGTRIVMENISRFLKAITSVIRGDEGISTAFQKAFGSAMGDAGGILGDIVEAIQEQLGPATKDLWQAFKQFLTVSWNKAKSYFGGMISDWWEKFSFVEFIKENPKTSMTIAAYLFGPAFLKSGLAMAGTALTKILVGGGATAIKGATPGFTGGMKTMMMGAARASIAIAAAYIAFEMGSLMYEIYSNQKELQNQTKNVDVLNEKKKKSLDEQINKIGLQKEAIDSLYKLEGSALGNKIELLRKENDLSSESINILRQRHKADIQAQLDKSVAKQQENVSSLLYAGASDEQVEKYIQSESKTRQDLSKRLIQIDKEYNNSLFEARQREGTRAIQQQMAETAKQAAELAEGSKVKTIDDVSEILGNVSKFSPKKVMKAEKDFAMTKSIITRKGGIKDNMMEIIVAFDDFDSSKFTKVTDNITKMSSIPKVLSMASTDLKAVSRLDLASSLSSTMSQLNDSIVEGEFILSSDAVKKLSEAEIQKPFIEASINSITQLISSFGEMKSQAAEMGDPKKMPIVKIIERMVSTVNKVNSNLSNINSINLKPKLQNLGKVLGYQGGDKYTIHNKDFKIDFNIKVVMEVDDVEKVLLERGKIATSKA